MMNRQNNEIQAHFYANQGLKIVEAIGTSACAVPPCTLYLKTDFDPYTLVGNPIELVGENNLFTRTISIEAGLDTSHKVTAIIEWTDSTGEHEVTAKRIIF